MANRILKEIGWEDRIRLKLMVDEAYLPNSELQEPDIIDVAEAFIIDLVPGYASLEGDDKVRLEAATVCQCAIILCPSMPSRMPVREQGPHFTRDLEQDWDKRKKEMLNERDYYLGTIITMPKVRRFTSSGRG